MSLLAFADTQSVSPCLLIPIYATEIETLVLQITHDLIIFYSDSSQVHSSIPHAHIGLHFYYILDLYIVYFISSFLYPFRVMFCICVLFILTAPENKITLHADEALISDPDAAILRGWCLGRHSSNGCKKSHHVSPCNIGPPCYNVSLSKCHASHIDGMGGLGNISPLGGTH